MIFYISDLHFNHFNILRYCNRPFKDLKEMEEVIVKNWNSVVTAEDTVYVVGDFGFVNITEGRRILNSLNGKKLLIIGNHDKKINNMLSMGFSEVHEKLELSYGGYDFIVCHYPYYPSLFGHIKAIYRLIRSKNWKLSKIFKVYFRYVAKKKKNPRREYRTKKWLIHGHVHNSMGLIHKSLKMVNVSCDVTNFTPISFNFIVELINKS